MIAINLFWGIIANFIGYIPPGNINLTVVLTNINRGIKQTVYLISAFCFIEFFITILIMRFAQWISHTLNLNILIDWIMTALFLILGIISYVNRNKPPQTTYSSGDSIKYGFLLGFMNPMQIPFWTIAGTILITKKLIVAGWVPLIVFSVGSSIGAFLCLYIYAILSRKLMDKLSLSSKVINTGISFIFFGFALYTLGKLFFLLILHK